MLKNQRLRALIMTMTALLISYEANAAAMPHGRPLLAVYQHVGVTAPDTPPDHLAHFSIAIEIVNDGAALGGVSVGEVAFLHGTSAEAHGRDVTVTRYPAGADPHDWTPFTGDGEPFRGALPPGTTRLFLYGRVDRYPLTSPARFRLTLRCRGRSTPIVIEGEIMEGPS